WLLGSGFWLLPPNYPFFPSDPELPRHTWYNILLDKENTAMKFFLDTANLEEIRDAASTGILDGITTNPTLISKEGNKFEDQLLKICALVRGPVGQEPFSCESGGWVEEGRHLAKLHPNIVLKCPMTKE